MQRRSLLYYFLVFLVAVTFSVIGFTYHQSGGYSTVFYFELATCIGLLAWLFLYQRKLYNQQLDKLTDDVDRDWLQGLFLHFPLGMLLLDKSGNIFYCNHRAIKFFDLDPADLQQMNIEQLLGSKALQFYLDSIKSSSKSDSWRDEFLLDGDSSNSFKWLALNVCSIPLNKSANQFWSLTLEDVTAKRVLRDKLDRMRGEQALILDNTNMGLALVMDKQVVRANNALGLLLGKYTSSMINQPWSTVFQSTTDSDEILTRVVAQLSEQETYETEIKLLRENGTKFWCHMTAKAASMQGTSSGIIFSFKDATGQRDRDDELRKAAVVFEASSDAIMVLDAEGLVRMVNSSFTNMTGFTEIDIVGKSPRLLRATRQDEKRYDSMWQSVVKNGHWRGELWRRKKSGETYPEWTSVTAVKDSNDQVLEYVIIGSDMSERKYAENRILYQANYDQLTNLPNRNLFMDRLHQSLQRVQREDTVLALLFIDLDRFKNINDSLGHSAGDKLLVKVAQVMRKAVRESDSIARFGGDEFAIILSPIYGPKNASRVAQALLEALSQPIDIDGYKAIIGASIGISMYPADGTIEEELVKNADTAMYRAKESGRNNYQFFTEEMQQAAKDRLLIENDLRDAIERQELRIVFQPQVDAKSKKLAGAEVLVRWQNQARGMVSPSEFIYIAEDTGLIVPIGEWVLRQSCLQYKRWLNAGVAPPYLAINVSGRQFKMDGFAQSVYDILKESGLESKYVELELTESFLMDDQEFAISTLKELKEMGFQLSIDDFGTGYSSLSYLKKFPIDRLKIDRSFVIDIETNNEDRAIVRAIIDLAHTLNITVIAEGVEEQSQSDMLARMGCDIIQGYYYSKPIDGVAFTLYLQQQLKILNGDD